MNAGNLIQLIQNPSIGALTIWQFVVGFYHEDKKATPIDYLFTVIPIVSTPEIREVICHTTGGLLSYRAKLSKSCSNNALLNAAGITPLMYELSGQSIKIATSSKLIKQENGLLKFVPVITNIPSSVKPSDTERDYRLAAKRLGKQMAQMSRSEIFASLGVRF
ncbi:three component ABC system middle component [Parvibacter caecicola]|uniref:Uncharacterized protein n=1 Tax=Parvibacter caecicola TaxID=747645 RepID=A0A4V5KJY4_9ACTN|nr:three component ABC system middle component [Parvibacter caecicola]TJW11506.1 hypothetical protein E5982_04730 [Parvibacter caecicola]